MVDRKRVQEFMDCLNHTNPSIKRAVITAKETPEAVIAVLKISKKQVAKSYINKEGIAGREPKQLAMEKVKELVEWYKSIKEPDNGRQRTHEAMPGRC